MKNKLRFTLLLISASFALHGCSNQQQTEIAKPITSSPTENTLKPKKVSAPVLSPLQIKEKKRKKELKAKHEYNLKIQSEKKRAEAQRVATIKGSVAYQLATIDNGHVEIDSRPVKRFRSLIAQLT